MRFWESEWLRTREVAWAWAPKDFAALAKARSLASGDLLEVQVRITRLLTSKDIWLARNASPGLLVSRWNQLAVEIVTPRERAEALAEDALKLYFSTPLPKGWQ